MGTDLFGESRPESAGGGRRRSAEPRGRERNSAAVAGQPRTKREKHSREVEKAAAFYACIVPPATAQETKFRHGHWETRRGKVRAALTACNSNTFFMNRFDECGSELRMEYSPSLKKHRLRGNYCRCRHCEPCMRAKSLKIMANLRHRLAERPAGRYRFITLTRRHDDKPLAEQIAELYKWFKKLRSLPLWKETQHGGAVMLEVKYIEKNDQWHPHLHLVAEGGWINQDELAAAWLQVTGTSDVVDIRAIDSQKDAAAYVAKYVTKGTSPAVWDHPDRAQEWITASKGVRIANTFGNWRGFALLSNSDTANDWAPVCSFQSLLDAVGRHERWAEDALINLRPPGSGDSS